MSADAEQPEQPQIIRNVELISVNIERVDSELRPVVIVRDLDTGLIYHLLGMIEEARVRRDDLDPGAGQVA